MTSRERRWLFAAITFSVVIRLSLAGVALWTRNDVRAFLAPDSTRYLELGQQLLENGTFGTDGQPELHRLPGLPLLVALASALGYPVAATILAQALLGAATTALCFLAARQFAGIRGGLWAATLYALEPGQWAWSSMVMTETLFTFLVAASFWMAGAYLQRGRQPALLSAVALAALSAYVRLVGYPFAFVVAVAAIWTVGRSPAGLDYRTRMRHLTSAVLLVVAILGAWHVRNAVTTGYAGFSIQFERAAYAVGGATVEARQAHADFGETYTDMRKAAEQSAGDDPALLATGMRESGIRAAVSHPILFGSTYVAGIGSTLLHPGTAALMRLVRPEGFDAGPSAGQMLTMGRWESARSIIARKGRVYWLLTVPLFVLNLVYLTLFAVAAWTGRCSPAVRLACVMAACFLLLSGGPDGDSRRRVPMVPLMCVVAASVSPIFYFGARSRA